MSVCIRCSYCNSCFVFWSTRFISRPCLCLQLHCFLHVTIKIIRQDMSRFTNDNHLFISFSKFLAKKIGQDRSRFTSHNHLLISYSNCHAKIIRHDRSRFTSHNHVPISYSKFRAKIIHQDRLHFTGINHFPIPYSKSHDFNSWYSAHK